MSHQSSRIPLSNHLRQILNLLSPLHPLTRFLSIQGDQCIPNYPDKNIPTLLMYRNGDCLGQVVGLKGGLGTTAMGESLFFPTSRIAKPRSKRYRTPLAWVQDNRQAQPGHSAYMETTHQVHPIRSHRRRRIIRRGQSRRFRRRCGIWNDCEGSEGR